LKQIRITAPVLVDLVRARRVRTVTLDEVSPTVDPAPSIRIREEVDINLNGASITERPTDRGYD
jgi:hypothetical protein